MDVSFGVFNGRNGWGDQKSDFTPQNYKKANKRKSLSSLDKIPIPVTINDLLNVSSTEEKYKIGSYTFSTIKVVGTIVDVKVDDDETCITYSLCDFSEKNTKTAPLFNVIRYEGIEKFEQITFLRKGVNVQAIGKLRHYNNCLNLVSFYIKAVNSFEDVEIFQLEARLSKIYYLKDFPNCELNQLSSLGPMFCQDFTQKENTSYNFNMNCQNNSIHCSNAPIPYNGSNFNKNQPNSVNSIPKKNTTITTIQTTKTITNSNDSSPKGQKGKIYKYIQEFGSGEVGVSLSELKSGINGNSNFLNDLNSMLNDSIIYSTIDDEHFAVI